jgi:hypothetical protein
VFRGKEGVGKGVYGRAMKDIFGQHGMQISSSVHLTGHFNWHLRDLVLLFADEAFWPGDKSGEGTLKRIISEPTLSIERKGYDIIEVDNKLHVIIASNNDWVVPAGVDARRFAMFNVSEKHKQDQEYFTKLFEQMRNGGLQAMLHDLLAMDLGDWHPRNDVPQTKALHEQKNISLLPADQWWLNLLEEGILPGNVESANPANQRPPFNPSRAESQHLFKHARETVPGLKHSSDNALGKILRDRGCHSIGRMPTTDRRGWQFPSLSSCRLEWDSKMRMNHRWVGSPEWRVEKW